MNNLRLFDLQYRLYLCEEGRQLILNSLSQPARILEVFKFNSNIAKSKKTKRDLEIDKRVG